jgi:hypothetical protein
MPEPAAKEDDKVVATDTHLVSGAPVDVPFAGELDGNLSPNVFMEHKHAAMIDSTAKNVPPHAPPAGKNFDRTPANIAVVSTSSTSVFINKRLAARNGDKARTCNDPDEDPKKPGRGTIIAGGKVLIGR